MARAIALFSAPAAWTLPHPLAGYGQHVSRFWRDMTRDLLRPYRPERHYMRGPGPAWRAKYGQPQA